MKLGDIPPKILVGSFLKAAAQAGIEATVVWAHPRDSGAMSNNGPTGMAKAAAALSIKDGAAEAAAIALHDWRLRNDKGEIDGPDLCALCPLLIDDVHAKGLEGLPASPKWEELDEPTKAFHRNIANIAIAAALAHSVQQRAQPSRIVRV